MEFLKEALKSVKRLDNEDSANSEKLPSDDTELDDFDLEASEPTDSEGSSPDEEPGNFDLDPESSEGSEDQQLDNVASQASEDPNRRGLIRTIKKAHLVYKREGADNNFEELWIFNAGNMKDELNIRKAILAGTDIPVNNTCSPDGKQEYTIWTNGNIEMLHITGLVN